MSSMNNSDTDDPADHGTEDHCGSCTGSGCHAVAGTLTLTLSVQVRRTTGPASATGDILWALQDRIAGIDCFDVADGGEYQITHVDYTIPAAVVTESPQPDPAPGGDEHPHDYGDYSDVQ